VHEPLGQLRDVWTVVDGRRMFASVSTHSFPTGLPPVVLVHGLSMSSWYLTPFARQLAPFCPIYIPDLPGFGRSERPPRALTMVELADALAGWMRAMGLERAVILGHSLGCQVVARFAERHPEMALGVILASPTMDSDVSGLVFFLRSLLNFVYEPFTMTTLVLTGVPRADPWRTWRTFYHALTDHCEESYPAIRCPALVVCGTRDPIAPQRWAERVAGMLPERRPLCLLQGHTHAMNLTAPRALLRVTLPFLREVASKGRMPLPQAHERMLRREASDSPAREAIEAR
jgi:2-hydroxy-6-oxonona-2,4-dienedioate hydrolase